MGKVRARSPQEQSERYNLILKTATNLFMTEKYEDVSLSKIAADMNLSRPALYSYFKSKESLFLTLIENEYLNLSEQLKQSFTTQLSAEKFCQNLVNLFIKNPKFLKLQSLHQAAMEEKISQEEMYHFKEKTKIFFETLTNISKKQFSLASPSQIELFIQQITVLLPTMYNYAHIPQEQIEAMQDLKIFGQAPLYSIAEFYTTLFLELCPEAK